ncbi:MAG: hypothetical protein KC680_04050, partial [Candidatus Peregrinibacteria bacterium]|nr:hypothetical protein [Candidatus Peregrinibacteria bacterium]
MSITLIRIGLFLLAVLSPLLTFATLWQIKEWRIDRLKEHLRSEGYIRQLIGILRPVILVITLLSLQLTHLPTYAYIDACIAVMAGMALLQIIGRKQRYPRWTLKAMLLVLGALCINLALITLLHNNNWTLVGSLLAQPVILALVWALFLPIDRIMKRQMMQKAASLRQTYKNMMVIGITGSVGKTTTKELIAHLLAEKDIIFTPAYVNSEMGVSKWLLSELPRHSTDDALIAIIEMGAYRKGEIARLCGITQPTMGMITYIGSQHIALFGSQDALCNAKAELVQYLPQTGVAFINGDNELCQKALAHTKAKHIVVGTG